MYVYRVALPVFTAALFIIGKVLKLEPVHTSVGRGWINAVMQPCCRLLLGSSVYQLHVTRGVNLKVIRLSERSHTKKRNTYVIPFIYNSGKCKLLYSDRSVVAWGGGTTKDIWGDGCLFCR